MEPQQIQINPMPRELFNLENFFDQTRQCNAHVAQQIELLAGVKQRRMHAVDTAIQEIKEKHDEQQRKLIELRAAHEIATTARLNHKRAFAAENQRTGLNEPRDVKEARFNFEKLIDGNLKEIVELIKEAYDYCQKANADGIAADFDSYERIIGMYSGETTALMTSARAEFSLYKDAIKANQEFRSNEITTHLKVRKAFSDEWFANQKLLSKNREVELEHNLGVLKHNLDRVKIEASIANDERKTNLEERKMELSNQVEQAKLVLERFKVEQETIARLAEANRLSDSGDSCTIF